MADIKKLEKELWEAADNLRANSKLTSQQYCMPVLGLIFLRYAWGRFNRIDAQIKEERAQKIHHTKDSLMKGMPSTMHKVDATHLPLLLLLLQEKVVVYSLEAHIT
jgi:type I restriction-modification system DNA methylase subunit